jgi:hypothetical protein
VTAARLLQGWRARAVQGALAVVALSLLAGVYLLKVIPAWKVHAAYLGVFACGWLLLLAVLRVSSSACDLVSAKS